MYAIRSYYVYPWESYPFLKEWNFTIAPYAPYGHLWFIYALLFLSTFAVAMSYFPMILQILFTVFISYAFNYRLSNGEFQYSITHHLFEMLAFRGLPARQKSNRIISDRREQNTSINSEK